MIGTGQTAWMQGVRYGIMLDSIVNDFLTGEIEHVIWSAWDELHPDVIVIEGQGSLLNPAYPGGYELLAAARPDAVILAACPHQNSLRWISQLQDSSAVASDSGNRGCFVQAGGGNNDKS